jgi:hypothetical protein
VHAETQALKYAAAPGAGVGTMPRNASMLSVEKAGPPNIGWPSPRRNGLSPSASPPKSPAACYSPSPSPGSPSARAPAPPPVERWPAVPRALTPRAKVMQAKHVVGRQAWRELGKGERVHIAKEVGEWMGGQRSGSARAATAGRVARAPSTPSTSSGSVPVASARTERFRASGTTSEWHASWSQDEGGELTWTESWLPSATASRTAPPGTPLVAKVGRTVSKLQGMRPIHLPNRTGRGRALGTK